MSKLFLPKQEQKFLDENGSVSRVWLAFFNDLFTRVGGYVAAPLSDIEAADFSDAGVEELKADLYQLTNNLNSDPDAGIEELKAELYSLTNSFNSAPNEEIMLLVYSMETRMISMRDELAQIQKDLDGMKSGKEQ